MRRKSTKSSGRGSSTWKTEPNQWGSNSIWYYSVSAKRPAVLHLQISHHRGEKHSKRRTIWWGLAPLVNGGKETKNSTQTVEGWSVQRRSCCAEIKMGVKTFQRLQRFLGLQRGAERQEGGERQKKAKPGWAGTAGRAGCKTVRKFLFSTEALIGHLTWQQQTPALKQKWCVKCSQSQSLPSSISGWNRSCSMVFYI